MTSPRVSELYKYNPTRCLDYLVCFCCRGIRQPQRRLGEAANTRDYERRSETLLLHESLQSSQQLLTRADPDRMDLEGRSCSC